MTGARDDDGLRRRDGVVARGPGHGPLGWWGAIMVVLCLSMALLTALFAAAYLHIEKGPWPPPPATAPPLGGAVLAAVLVLGAAGTAVGLDRAARRGSVTGMQAWAGATLLLGGAFLAASLGAHGDAGVDPRAHAYGSVFLLNLGLHQVLTAGGLAGLGVLALSAPSEAGLAGERSTGGARGLAAYWIFLAVSWLAIVGVLYGGPRLWTGGPG